MKKTLLIAVLSLLSTQSVFADTTPIRQIFSGCYNETVDGHKYLAKIEITNINVKIAYRNGRRWDSGYFGSVYGDLKMEQNSLLISNLTLRDGADGWMDHVTIEINNGKINVSQPGDSSRLKQIVTCPE